jgi:hypothetical protein
MLATLTFGIVQHAASSAAASPWADVPSWLLALVGAVVLALALWIFLKLLKLAIWIAIAAVLVGGVVLAARLFIVS